MATNPSPFSPDELASFASVETPKAAETASVGLSREEAELLMHQGRAEQQREIDFLRGQLSAQQQYAQQNQQTQTTQAPTDIPVVFDKDGKAVITPDALEGIIDSKLNKYHKETVEPFAPTVQQLHQQQSINQAAEAIRGIAPDLLEGKDANTIGKLAIDFFNSPFAPDKTDAGRQKYAVEQIRTLYGGQGQNTLPLSTGSNLMQNFAPAYNQTGQTQAGGQATNPYGYPKGATINLEPKSINDLGGIDQYQAYAAWQNGLREYNRMNNMGWSIVEK